MIIAGDAAHVNNPLGGMGLNGGIHDAFNLSGKLIEVIRGAPIETLERYSCQRRKVALDVVQQTTLRNRAILNTRDPAARQTYYDELRRIAAIRRNTATTSCGRRCSNHCATSNSSRDHASKLGTKSPRFS
jgi:3-(3-hydroxy-phenyl)propionate hydroxylase